MKDLTHDTTHGELHSELAGTFDTTAMATESTLLNPRFYTTDFDALDRIAGRRPAKDQPLGSDRRPDDIQCAHLLTSAILFSTPIDQRHPCCATCVHCQIVT